MTRPVVFLGPSLAYDEARALADVELRPPVRRGDLPGLPPEVRVVGLVDGEFAQSLAVSPSEIRALLDRGVRVLGAASMGALRAAELHVVGMEGIGTVFSWYRDGVIDADDEVALLYDATFRPLTTPLVNLRYAVTRATETELLSVAQGEAVLAAGRSLSFRDRTLRHVLTIAGLDRALAAELARWDIKAEDARQLLHRLASGA